ncbi:hypothetical protein Ahy_A05g022041 isoform A [Arachis hypogaea]|uniref:C2H2-type domain-containing protein n=1 Tax=Arachis hypogaea TaxID=3818 RepID=A0A445CZG8_ARAHY|nr:hypothetical protein Ahy_A05g022041 isoform A [Arachis hypogaea]
MAEEQALLFTCVNCSHGNFFERARLEQHSKQKHDNYEYFCEKCSNCFETKASLTQHIGECRHWDGHRPPPEQKVLWSWRKSIKDARSTNNNAKSPKKGIYEFNRVAVTRSTNNNAKSQSSFNKLHIYPKVFDTTTCISLVGNGALMQCSQHLDENLHLYRKSYRRCCSSTEELDHHY